MHYLFGTATSDQFQKVKSKTNKLQNNDIQIKHSLEEQISVMKNLNIFQNKSINIVKNLTSETEILSKAFYKLESESNINQQANRANVFGRRIRNKIAEANSFLLELKLALEHIAHGHLSTFFLPRDKFVLALKEIDNFLPARFQMPFPISNSFLSKYYSVTNVHAAIEDTSLHVIIDIPLKTQDRFFNVFKLVPIPISFPNNSFGIFVNPPAQYAAISSSKLIYSALSTEDLLKCKKLAITICPPSSIIRSFKPNTCMYAVYNNITNDVIKFCDKIVVPAKRQPLFYNPQKSNSWIFSVPEPIRATIQCPDSDDQNIGTPVIFKGNGRIDIPFGCGIIADDFQIDTPDVFQSDMEISAPSFFAPKTKTVVTRNDVEFFANINADPKRRETLNKLMSEVDSLETSPDLMGIKLSKLKNKLKNIDEDTFRLADHFDILCFTFIFSVILITAPVLYCCFKLKTHKTKRETEGIEMDSM